MTAIARGQITITEQYDGKRGKDAANVYLSTQMLLVNTNDSGVVTNTELKGIEAQVLAYRGDEQTEAIIVSCQCSPEVAAETDGDTIKLTAVRTDEDTHMAYGSGYIDIVAEVEGKNYPLRLFVGTNITKLTASVVSDVRAFRQHHHGSVGTLTGSEPSARHRLPWRPDNQCTPRRRNGGDNIRRRPTESPHRTPLHARRCKGADHAEVCRQVMVGKSGSRQEVHRIHVDDDTRQDHHRLRHIP